jgi:hypothetical protein
VGQAVVKRKDENSREYQTELGKGPKAKSWKGIAAKVTTAAMKVIPEKAKIKRNNWVTDEILELISKIKKMTEKPEIRKMGKIIQRLCREAKAEEINRLCRKVEKLEKENRTREMYQIVRRLAPKIGATAGATILDAEGNSITNKEHISKRWREYMQELYKNSGKNLERTGTTSTEVTSEEIIRAIRSIKNNKATGDDKIPIEFIKHANDQTIEEVINCVKEIYAGSRIPPEWLNTIFVPIPKKKNAKKCEDYRTIALIPHAMKVLTKVMVNRMSEGLVGKLD